MSHFDYEIDVAPSSEKSGSKGKGVAASKDNACPLCFALDWCYILDGGDAVICDRTDIAPDGWEQTGTAKDGRPIFAKIGSGRKRSDLRYKGILPNPEGVALKPSSKTNIPQWKEVNCDYRGIKELEIEFLYPDAATGKPLGKVVRKQWTDRRNAYNGGRDSKHIRPFHWQEPYHPDQGDQGWWSDRGAGDNPWALYREAEVRDAIVSGECEIVFVGTGEQSVESYRQLGLYGTCPRGGEGTGTSQLVDFLKQHTPRVVVIAPDDDEAGHKAAAKLQEACKKLPTITINLKNVWAALPHKGDITNILLESGMSESDIVRQLEAEIRRAIAIRAEVQRRLNDPAERLKLELHQLLGETDFVKILQQRADIASRYRIKGSDIDQALKYIERQTATSQPRCLEIDELFDLPQPGINYLIPGMLPAGDTVLLVADPKCGKSLLAYDAAYAVATGEDTFLGETVAQGKVLIVQTDESVGTARGRLFKRGFRREDRGKIRFMDSFTMDQLPELEKIVEDFRPSLVMVDNLRSINAGEVISENSAEFADRIYKFKAAINRYGASAILIHHSNKNNEAVGTQRVRGSSAIAGSVWGVWQVDHIPKPDPNNKKKLIIDPQDPTRLLSVMARDVEGQRLLIELDPENNRWINRGEAGGDGEAAASKKKQEDLVLDLLRPIAPKGMESREIQEILGIDRGIYSVLNRLVGKGIIGTRPSSVDKRRTVYYYPSDSDPDQPQPESQPDPEPNSQLQPESQPENKAAYPPPPTPCVQICDPSPGTYVESQLEIDHKIDHKLITNRSQEEAVQPHGTATTCVQEGFQGLITNSAAGGGSGGSSSCDQSSCQEGDVHPEPLGTSPDPITDQPDSDATKVAHWREVAAIILQCQTWVALVQKLDEIGAKYNKDKSATLKMVVKHGLDKEGRDCLTQLLSKHIKESPRDCWAYNWIPDTCKQLREKALDMARSGGVGDLHRETGVWRSNQ